MSLRESTNTHLHNQGPEYKKFPVGRIYNLESWVNAAELGKINKKKTVIESKIVGQHIILVGSNAISIKNWAAMLIIVQSQIINIGLGNLYTNDWG